MNKIWQLLSSILILICNTGSVKIDNQSQIEIKQDSIKTNDDKTKIINNIHFHNEIIDLKVIKFQILRFNFSQFTINELGKWIFQDINQTFGLYKINLDYPSDYDVKPVDDATLNQFLISENYYLPITIYLQDKSDNPPSAKKQNLIIMTSISILVISFLIIIIFLKARFKKGIGIKKKKNAKNSHYSTNKNKMKKNEENKVINLLLEEKHIIKMNNKTKKRKNKTKKAKKKKQKSYYQI